MYCRTCGYQMHPNASICVRCGCAKNVGNAFCWNCGQPIHPNAGYCVQCGAATQATPPADAKSKIVAGILGIILGCYGVHNFYLGYTSKGIAQLVLCFCGLFTFGLSSIAAYIWGLVEGIRILTGSIKVDAKGVPLKD